MRARIRHLKKRLVKRGRFSMLFVIITLCAAFSAHAQTRHYYAIENLSTGAILQRGKADASGIPANTLILAPNLHCREWLFNADNGLTGSQEFRTPPAGERLTLPPVRMGLSFSPDSDGDELSDDAEFILGTDPAKADSDGDGISDGAALRLGLDPGAAFRTGIIGSSDTPGTALDVCAINNLAVVADGAAGVTVFNVFNRMAPVRIARVDTPGTAQAVSCSGNLIAVADGSAGLTIIDITDPTAARTLFQVSANNLGGDNTRAVVAIGDLAFTGTESGVLSMTELSSGTVLERVNLGARIDDVATTGETLFVLLPAELRAFDFSSGVVQALGSVAISSAVPETITGRKRLFVGGGEALVTCNYGFDRIDVRAPDRMVLVAPAQGTINSFKQIVAADPGLAVATVGNNPRDDGTHDLRRFYLTNRTEVANSDLTLATPGIARAVSIYNGLAYVADSANGLHVMVFQDTDHGGRPPTGTLRLSTTNGAVSEGGRLILSADVRDDVQIRNVEFRVDGQRHLVDGNYPFEVGWRAPARSAGAIVTFDAIVTDTGGNRTNLGPIAVQTLKDADPPRIVINSPAPGQSFAVGDDLFLDVEATDATGVASLVFQLNDTTLTLERLGAHLWRFPVRMQAGVYRLAVTATDNAGYPRTVVRSIVVRGEAIGREFTVFHFDVSPGREAISREFSVFHFDAPPGNEAIAREFTVEHRDK